MQTFLNMKIDISQLNKQQREDLESALCAQYEGVEVGDVKMTVTQVGLCSACGDCYCSGFHPDLEEQEDSAEW